MKKLSILLILMGIVIGTIGFAQEQEPKKKEKEKPKEEEKYEGTNIIVEQVVTASKRSEKRMETPSSIESISDEDLMKSAGTTYSSAMAQVKGLDFANGGINLQKISTRGFSSSFNSRMISLTDGTLSTLPGAGLPQGGLSSVSALDIKGLEVILGPAGALYGSNTTAGVVNVITKDPWDEEGFSVDVRGGEQSLMNIQMRLAGVSSNGQWGYKLTADYLDADEFESGNMFDIAGNNQTTPGFDATTAMHEWDIAEDHNVTSKKLELKGYYKSSFATLEASYSFSENDGFGVTNVGRNRIEGWQIEDYQFRASSDRWFFNITHTKEDAGTTYSVQNVVGLLALGMSIEAAREEAKFINLSSMTDVELQGNWTIQSLEIIAGGSFRTYDPDSKGSYLDDVEADGSHKDISRDELGLYVQLDYRAMDEKLRFVLAGRYDDFTEFDSQFSPKFGVTYNADQHVFRANYMTSYRVPEIIENHLFFFGGLARGNLEGFDVYSNDGTLLAQYEGLQPEDVTTVELGYRGLWGSNTAVDFVVYKSDYENFISPLQLFANAAFGTYALWSNGEILPVLFSYTNYGKAEIEGADLGFDFFVNDKVTVKTSISYNKLNSFNNNTVIPDIPFNTPEWKYKASLNWDKFVVDKAFFNMSGRLTDSYEYLSGRWSGEIDADPIFDLAFGYNLMENSYLKLSWSNVTDQDKSELLGTPALPSYVTFEFFKKF